jgi:hypothetical protein
VRTVVTPIKKSEEAVTIRYKLEAYYSFSAGIAYTKFLNGLKEGKIIGRKCYRCGRVYVPPRMYCDDCFRPTDDWVEVSDEGVIETASASYISWTRDKLEEPEIIAVIRLGGREKDWIFPGLFHRICGKVDVDQLIGKKVKAVWREKREGSINDIECFKVVEG